METWKDIVAEMREVSGDETVSEIVISKRDWLALAERIEAACKTLEAENVELRRALEPVMACEVYRKVFHINGGHSLEPNFDWMIDAVREAQKIMKKCA